MIALNDFVRQWDDIGNDATAAFSEVGRSGWYVLGEAVARFENALAAWWGSKHAIGVASGLDALEIALRIAGCGSGDRVLTTPVSAFATTLAICRTGATPIFGSVDDLGMLDLDDAHDMLAKNPGIRFMVPVHLYGHALNREKLAALRREFGVMVIEDCAQSAGASWAGHATGITGEIAATSFYPTKNLGALGDAGAILTQSDAYARAARVYRDYGQSRKYEHDVMGANSRLDEVQAAVLQSAALPRLCHWIERRREIAAQYVAGISHPRIAVPAAHPACRPSWHLFPILVTEGRKAAFREEMQRAGVMTGEHYPTPIPDQKAMHGTAAEMEPEKLQRARRFCHSEVSLPIHPYLRDEEIATVIQAVNRWGG